MTSDNNGIDYLKSKDGGYARKRTRSNSDDEKRQLNGKAFKVRQKCRGRILALKPLEGDRKLDDTDADGKRKLRRGTCVNKPVCKGVLEQILCKEATLPWCRGQV